MNGSKVRAIYADVADTENELLVVLNNVAHTASVSVNEKNAARGSKNMSKWHIVERRYESRQHSISYALKTVLDHPAADLHETVGHFINGLATGINLGTGTNPTRWTVNFWAETMVESKSGLAPLMVDVAYCYYSHSWKIQLAGEGFID